MFSAVFCNLIQDMTAKTFKITYLKKKLTRYDVYTVTLLKLKENFAAIQNSKI